MHIRAFVQRRQGPSKSGTATGTVLVEGGGDEKGGGGGVAYHTVLFAYIVHAFYACTPHALRLRKWYSVASNTESGTAFAIPALPPRCP